MAQLIDLTGQQIGSLEVIERVENRGHHVMWRCRCRCGNEVTRSTETLLKRSEPTCGCASREFGKYRWKMIEGYKGEYRINEGGVVQKKIRGEWTTLTPVLSKKRRVCVKMRTLDNKSKHIPIVWLMADAFMGGHRPGVPILHINGAKFDCGLWNLKFSSYEECGRATNNGRKKTVVRIDRNGEIVDIYPSVTAAAKKTRLPITAIQRRCAGQVKNPYSLDGYDYQYEENMEDEFYED